MAQHGKLGFLLAGGYNLSPYYNSIGSALGRDTAEDTGFEAPGWGKTYLPGLSDDNPTFEGRYAGIKDVVELELNEMLGGAGADNPTMILFGPRGEVGDIVLPRLSHKNSFNTSSVISEVVGITGGFQNTGPLAYARLLQTYRTSPIAWQNEIQTIRIPTGTGSTSVTVKGTKVGVAGTATISDASTDAQVKTALGALSSVGHASNVIVSKNVAGGASTFTVEFTGQLRQLDIQQMTSATGGVTTDTTQNGGVVLNIVNATVSGTAVDHGAATSNGGRALLHAIFKGGTSPSLPVLVEDSADGSTGWATIATFTTRTTIGAQYIDISGAIRRYTRFRVPSGIAGNWAFAVAIARY